MSRSRLWIIVVLLVAVIASSLFFLDWRAAYARTDITRDMTTFGFGTDRPANMAPEASLTYVVTGDTPLARAVRARLAEGRGQVGYSQVQVVDQIPASAPGAVLLIDLQAQRPLWTPIYAHAKLAPPFYFASTGKLDWRHDQTVAMTSDDGDQVLARGQVALSDNSFGVVSRPGYYGYLADRLLADLDEALTQLAARF